MCTLDCASSQASYDKATGYIKKALDAGGKLVSGGLEKCRSRFGHFRIHTVGQVD